MIVQNMITGIGVLTCLVTILGFCIRMVRWQSSVDNRLNTVYTSLDTMEKANYWQDTALQLILEEILDVDDVEKREKITELLMQRLPMGNPEYKDSKLEQYYYQKLDEWGVPYERPEN